MVRVSVRTGARAGSVGDDHHALGRVRVRVGVRARFRFGFGFEFGWAHDSGGRCCDWSGYGSGRRLRWALRGVRGG